MPEIHLSTAVKMLEAPEPVDLVVLKNNGEVMTCEHVIGLNRQHYAGTRNIKFVKSQEIRKIRDCLIVAINGCRVFM